MKFLVCRLVPVTAVLAFTGLASAGPAAGPTPASATVVTNTGFSPADFTNHLAQLRPRLPAGFTVVVQPPFVVIGDEPADTVRRRATNLVKWAVDRLRKDYFPRDPPHIIDVWLFKDKPSYDKHVKEIFHDTPTTPFGYYSREHRALIMNIATGGGTLVHELVHPLMEGNFPACPPWFNEGLGSLYEQCGDKDGHIRGFTNWRLPGLQAAIRAGQTVPFEALCGMDERRFYLEPGAHYPQARYLCYYLQEQGLLGRFYREFVARAGEDPTGVKILKKVLGEDDLEAFRAKWEKFVLGLTFP